MSQAFAHVTRTPGRSADRRRSPLHVVPAALAQTGSGRFAGMCMALLALGLLTLLLLNTALAQGTFAVHDLSARSGALADQQHELTRAIDAERNPGRLADRALAMGMVPSRSMAFLRLSDGAILGVAEPAEADPPLVVVTTPRAPEPEPEAAATPTTDAAAPVAPTAAAPPVAPTAAAAPVAPTAAAPAAAVAEPAPPAVAPVG